LADQKFQNLLDGDPSPAFTAEIIMLGAMAHSVGATTLITRVMLRHLGEVFECFIQQTE
jgi:hypothetical protein